MKKLMHNYLSESVKKYQSCIIKKQDFSRKETTVKTFRSGFECKFNGQTQIE